MFRLYCFFKKVFTYLMVKFESLYVLNMDLALATQFSSSRLHAVEMRAERSSCFDILCSFSQD